MKMVINKTVQAAKKIWSDESAQGATEYILILVIIVGVVIMFGGKIKTALSSQTDALTTGIGSVTVNGGGGQ